ncbi:MAG TPA: ATP-binding protein, partial [Tepidiformaceae bacterium]|nr:ATP-binding protein [Tepidiformaceae bacterium]
RRHRLINLGAEPGQAWTPLTSRTITLDARILGYLMGGDAMDEVIDGPAREIEAKAVEALPDEWRALVEFPATALAPPLAVLWGSDPGRLREAAAAIAAGGGLPGLVELDIAAAREHASGTWELLARADREAALRGAALLLTRTDALELGERERLGRTVAAGIAPLRLIATEGEPRYPAPLLKVADLDYETRLACWRADLRAAGLEPPADDVLEALTGKFRLPRDNITAAVGLAHGMALTRNAEGPSVTPDDLYTAARTQSAVILSSLARKVTPHYHWGDIILEDDPLAQLREFCAMLEHRHLVYDVWGFDRKLAMGKGVIALFAGQSGTGKTMAADVIAGQLGLDLYKIDLSGVVSKYIGETEKNIGAIFKDAEQSNAILFFDEADALFGKRSEVKDAHDRYANIETAYLLQRMEEYAGAVILSTNLKMNLDEAFLRRMHFVIDFPMPEEPYRLRIWESTLPPELPRAEDIDLAFLARQFKISGGNIRNIVLAAAFLAADEGKELGMAHLIRGTRREF